MEKRYVMLWGDGVLHAKDNKNIFTREEIVSFFREELFFTEPTVRVSSVFEDKDEAEEVSFGAFLILLEDAGGMGEKICVWESEMAERGCDAVEMSLVSVNI